MQYDDVVQLFCDGKRNETYGEISKNHLDQDFDL